MGVIKDCDDPDYIEKYYAQVKNQNKEKAT
jgi:hypothetical protein